MKYLNTPNHECFIVHERCESWWYSYTLAYDLSRVREEREENDTLFFNASKSIISVRVERPDYPYSIFQIKYHNGKASWSEITRAAIQPWDDIATTPDTLVFKLSHLPIHARIVQHRTRE